jgi:lysophospholipase L1-like esterase
LLALLFVVLTLCVRWAQATTISMTNSAILYSPFNWGVTAERAKTINAGAYFKVIFSGASCQLTTDTSSNTAPYSQFWARVDGGAFTQYTLSATNPTFLVAQGLVKRKHFLEVVVKSTSETIDRWTKQRTAVVFTSLVLDTGATVTAPARKPFNILIFGDSITEGVRVNGYSGITYDTDRNDALQTYSWLLSQELPAEVGVVGFGATGINTSGSGGVPALGTSQAYLWAAQARSYTEPEPDLIVYNEGTNDGSSITTGMLAVVRALLNAAPNARQLLLLPFNGTHASELKTVVANAASNRVSYGDTKGFFTASDSSDSLHPYGYSHIGFIAPKMASLITPLLQLAPKGLSASASNSVVSLSWSALIGATNYYIKRATVSGGPYTTIATNTLTTYSDTTVLNGVSYYYVVSAALGTGESADSAEVRAVPEPLLRLRRMLGPEGAEILLSWPTNAGNPALFAAPDLTPPIPWQLVTNASSTTDGVNYVTLPATEDGQRFFRLRTP